MTFENSAFKAALKPVAEEKQHHLVLLGSGISYALRRGGMEWSLYTHQHLTYLSITRSSFGAVPGDIGLLKNLTTLLLHSNNISYISNSIGELINLKILDCSRNQLMLCPKEIGQLPKLKILNLASNSLLFIPSLRKNVALSILNLGSNNFELFPDVCYEELACLSELYINDNKIQEIPTTISKLSALKVLDLKFNLLEDLPNELANCNKLEKLNVEMNQIYDIKLEHLCSSVTNTEKIIEYLKSCPSRERKSTTVNNHKRKRNINLFVSDTNPLYIVRHILEIKGVTDGAREIKVVKQIDNRPFILACIIKDIKFTKESFKKFIHLQIKLLKKGWEDKNTTVIRTHDMNFIAPGNLIYTAKPPTQINIKPFPRNKLYTGEVLLKELQAEAENVCKITEANKYPERYEYLNLLKDKSLLPCLVDGEEQVISLPPIINSNTTKVSPSTQTMFVEVTSTQSLEACSYILDGFLKKLLVSGITNPTSTDTQGRYHMIVEQVRIEYLYFDMYVKTQHLIYPSKMHFRSVDLDEKSVVDIKREDGIP